MFYPFDKIRYSGCFLVEYWKWVKFRYNNETNNLYSYTVN